MRTIARAGLIGVLAWTASGQPTGDAPAFEVASIKPAQSTDRGFSVSVSGSRLTITKTDLSFLIRYAYDLRSLQLIVGGPGWVRSEQYDVIGKAEGDAKRSAEQFRPMLQALLADRFKLAIHREMREIPVYVLVVGKNGPKMVAVNGADPGPMSSSMTPGHLNAPKLSMARLAGLLGGMPELQNLVFDETGLTGIYTFTLEWSPDDGRSTSSGPSIFTAVQEQLGLKLEAVKRPVEHLVIDHAERPSEN
jgi:uncharacterized protein (TIGR03435 family)